MVTTLVHPWAFRRKSLRITQLGLAVQLDVTRHMVLRLEQGLFPHPPSNLLVKLGVLWKVDTSVLRQEYSDYQHNSRKHFRDNYTNFDHLWNYEGETHPLQYWREEQELSRIGFCKGLCLHESGINDYEKNKMRHIPVQLTEALEEINWDPLSLTTAVSTWRIKWR